MPPLPPHRDEPPSLSRPPLTLEELARLHVTFLPHELEKAPRPPLQGYTPGLYTTPIPQEIQGTGGVGERPAAYSPQLRGRDPAVQAAIIIINDYRQRGGDMSHLMSEAALAHVIRTCMSQRTERPTCARYRCPHCRSMAPLNRAVGARA